MRRRDDRGHSWSERGVEHAVIAIVRRLSPGFARKRITKKTRLHKDLGWDEWYVLRVVKPVRTALHERLEDRVVLRLKSVGDLVGYVWNKMEDMA